VKGIQMRKGELLVVECNVTVALKWKDERHITIMSPYLETVAAK
jgi:hypothetical protein